MEKRPTRHDTGSFYGNRAIDLFYGQRNSGAMVRNVAGDRSQRVHSFIINTGQGWTTITGEKYDSSTSVRARLQKQGGCLARLAQWEGFPRCGIRALFIPSG